MKKLLMTGALSALALTVSACGDNDADDATAMATDTATPVATETVTTAAADWPAGSKIVEENGVTYRVAPDDTRVDVSNQYRVVTVDGHRYRVDASGTGHRIDDGGLDIDLPAVEGIDVDFGVNKKGHLDLDVSTDGSDASNDRPGDVAQ